MGQVCFGRCFLLSLLIYFLILSFIAGASPVSQAESESRLQLKVDHPNVSARAQGDIGDITGFAEPVGASRFSSDLSISEEQALPFVHQPDAYSVRVEGTDRESAQVNLKKRLEPQYLHSTALQNRATQSNSRGFYFNQTADDQEDKCLALLHSYLQISSIAISSFIGPILFGQSTGADQILVDALEERRHTLIYVLARTGFDMSAEYLAFAYCRFSSQHYTINDVSDSKPENNDPATTVDVMATGGWINRAYCIVGQPDPCPSMLGHVATCTLIATKVTTANLMQWVLQRHGIPLAASIWNTFRDNLLQLRMVIVEVGEALGICIQYGPDGNMGMPGQPGRKRDDLTTLSN